jgi:hypothetical protein
LDRLLRGPGSTPSDARDGVPGGSQGEKPGRFALQFANDDRSPDPLEPTASFPCRQFIFG